MIETMPNKGKTTAIALALAALAITATSQPVQADGFYATGSLTEPSTSHTATLLENGKVLVVGSTFANLYDPDTGTFTPTAGQPLYEDEWGGGGRFNHAAIRLGDGKVLIVGGGNIFARLGLPDFPPPYTIHAELYDPVTDTFTQTGSMVNERTGIQPVLLQDGRVLIAGGEGCCVTVPINGTFFVSGSALAGAEIYDPSTGMFEEVRDPDDWPSLLDAPRAQVNVAPLPDGRILFAGGYATEISPTGGGMAQFFRYLATADIYDPVQQVFTPVAPMAFARANAVTVPLTDGSVHIAYQTLNAVSGRPTSTAPAERFDPITQTFTTMNRPPVYEDYNENRIIPGNAITLDSGKVLLAGGLSFSTAADLYNPQTDTYARTQGDMLSSRFDHTATKLADGRVIYIGGTRVDPETWEYNELSEAEIYDPNYVVDAIYANGFDASTKARPTFANAPARLLQSTCPDVNPPYASFTGAHMFLSPDGRVCHTTEIARPR